MRLYIALICFSVFSLYCEQLTLINTQWDNNKLTVTINMELGKDAILYKDFIKINTDTQLLKVTDWRMANAPIQLYDPQFKETKASFVGDNILTIHLEAMEFTKPFAIHIAYLMAHQPHPQEKIFTVAPEVHTSSATVEPLVAPAPASSTSVHSLKDKITSLVQFFKNYISTLVEQTQSLWIRLLAVFILGVLMSLTPCIYPMIPITLGILQTSSSTSFIRNFLLAGSYTLGMATMFASLGLLAATGSAQFGALMANPFFVIFLVIFLAYMGGTMFGFYELYIPRFMQPKKQTVKGGSFLSAFVFGAIAGTVASPCLSPGLMLLLSIVATLGNVFLGFVLLFFFGLGLGLPLLIIGTFSNSMNVMPRSGLWMVEIKKLFGLMLFSMCFYYLSNILPIKLIMLLSAAVWFIIALYVVITIKPYESRALKNYKYCMALILCIISFVLGLKALYVQAAPVSHSMVWQSQYAESHQRAKETHKLLLLDFGATWCTACTEVAHTILHTKVVEAVLEELVPVYIDCTNPNAEFCAPIQKQFNIVGFPTMLLIDPQTDIVLKRWGSEVLDRTAEEFAQELREFIK